MMKKIIFVSDLQIGNFLFQSFIVDLEGDLISFSIFIKGNEEPAVQFICDINLQVNISFNHRILKYINLNKTKDIKKRKEFYRMFVQFLVDSEKKAAYMIFKNQKLNYIKKSKDLLAIRDSYLYE
ncbi:hypothetical protein [Sphingobacterium bovistauri]|uniref:Uncharacterized protein n=1 Tax=Sphingobacterium bovistauri TaxID=2781959 RepID=A0ABS7Z9K4_9SPHI|nr:hypothetical protein [Sphingobacterium bovistauri]MCA5006844.1 hypothetical protein [Sphingobacterium bovistauri]